jgi:import receptor subunit TOM7
MIFQLSEESRERISKVLDLGRVALHYGWIHFVIYVGEYESEYSVGADTSVLTSV